MAEAQKTIVDTDSGLKNGLNRCPSCGSTDISLDETSGQLKCNMCRTLFKATKVAADDITQIKGEIIGSGAKAIIPDVKQVLTFKCSSCGASIVVNTEQSTSVRCHWCRHSLSINEQIANGAVPDMVLPFKLEKDAARNKIEEFVKKRQFYAHPLFKREFTAENVMGVYLPYMIVDLNGHSSLAGKGEHLVRRYTVGFGKNSRTYYDADLYAVSREFDILIDDLSIESSADKLNQNTAVNTNNVINAIMPFDTENCVTWNANFLRGYASEKRDTDTDRIKPLLITQSKDIARYKANDSLTFYDRGVTWITEDMKIIGLSWKSAYLPVWLYSYFQKDKNLLHYCAVNARSGETMGSVPVHKIKLLFVSAIIELIGIFIGTSIIMSSDDDAAMLGLLGYTVGFIYYFAIWKKYRNADQRHFYEKETKADLKNMQKSDEFVEHYKGLSNASMSGANNRRVEGNLNRGNSGALGKALEQINKLKGIG
jgi:ribosomal protein S27E